MRKLKEFLKLALLACPLVLPTSLHAQTLPVCAQTASDPDGDGFGWEFISTGFASGDFGSCLVTSESEPQPVIINKETGASVNLIRATGIWKTIYPTGGFNASRSSLMKPVRSM